MSQDTPSTPISKEEILAVCRQGEDAVVKLVSELLAKITALELRLETLENQQSKDSKNSSKPPSSDGFGKRTKSLREKSGLKRGGQIGHPGSTLEWSEEVHEVVVHQLIDCVGCGESLGAAKILDWDLRQVHDLPPLELLITEHQAEVKCCVNCGLVNRGQFPVNVTNVVQYGEGIKGLMVYLMEAQLLPSERSRELLEEVFSCHLSEGTLYNAREQCYEKLEEVEEYLKEAIENVEVGCFDETGLRVNSKLMWLHVACTDSLTYYFLHAKRGQIAMDAMDILPNFQGVSVHDGLSSYAQYDCKHGGASHLCDKYKYLESVSTGVRYI
jgi:transposase